MTHTKKTKLCHLKWDLLALAYQNSEEEEYFYYVTLWEHVWVYVYIILVIIFH
jgi:hypothetical protein